MEILVCVRRVPDTSENEIELNSAGNDIERDDLVYSVNEAGQLRGRRGPADRRPSRRKRHRGDGRRRR